MSKNVNLFVLSPPKTGTTYLYNLLKNNPSLSFGEIKEPHFHSSNIVKNSYYPSYSFVTTLQEYHDQFPNSLAKYKCDFSPSYCNFETIKKIYNYNSSAKIILLHRDKVERTLSHYTMDVANGFCKLTFSDAILKSNLKDKYYFEYIEQSRYLRKYSYIRELFGSTSILELSTNNLSSSETRTKLSEFLSIEVKAIEDSDAAQNRSKQRPKFLSEMYNTYSILPKVINRVPRVKKIIYDLLPDAKINVTRDEITLIRELLSE